MQALAVALYLVAASAAPSASSERGVAARGATEQARGHFHKGSALFKQKRYREAAVEFEAALRLRPHGHVFYNLAQCRERLGDAAGALSAYREYLRALPEAKDRSTVQAVMAKLEARLGAAGVQQLVVQTDPASAEVRVDGQPRGRTLFTATLPLGAHQVSLEKGGYQPFRREAVLTASRSLELEVALARAPEPSPGQAPGCAQPADLTVAGAAAAPAAPALDLRTGNAPDARPRPRRWTWVAAGVAGAALAVAIAYGVAASSASNDLRSREHDGATAQRLADTAASRSRTANVLYGVAAGAGAAGLTLFFVEGRF